MNHTGEDQYLDVKAILILIIKHWYLFAVFLMISLATAYLYNKTAVPEYMVQSTVLINVDNSDNQGSTGAPIQNLNMFSSITEFRNEVLFLESSPLIEKAIEEKDFSVSYFIKERFNNREIYNQGPFIVDYDPAHVQPINIPIYITFKDETSIQITVEAENVRLYNYSEKKITGFNPAVAVNKTYWFGEEIKSDDFDFRILLKDNLTISKYVGNTYAVVFNNIQELAFKYKGRLDIQAMDEESSVATISLRDKNIDKAVDFINALTSEYLKSNLEKKNYIASKTISFINNQLHQVQDSLNFVEKRLQDYRTTHQVMDISVKAGRIYRQLQELESERAALNVQAKYYQSIKDYFEDNQSISDLLAPSSMGIEDPLLTELIQELTYTIREQKNLETTNQQKSPQYLELVNEIEALKSTIKENINNIIRTSNIALDDIDERMMKLNLEVSKLPKTERELLGIERKFELNNEIYNYLLQRLAEAQIAKASNLPDYEIIEPARVMSLASPNIQVNFVIGIFAGLFLPGLFVFIKYAFLQNLILSKKDIRELTPLPVIGTIIHNTDKEINTVKNYPSSEIAESYRKLRTNLDYFTKGHDNQVILITSAFGNEGKSFNSVNIASILALTGKKTILLGFDLRKPTIQKYLGLRPLLGLSSYLINASNLHDIIMPTGIENLDMIPAGNRPPNPAELIDSEWTEDLISHLKQEYSYIIIDTPPLSLVTDTMLLMKHSDVNLLVIRERFSRKAELQTLFNELSDKGISNMALLLNDSKPKNRKKGYSFSYDYFDTNQKSFFRKLFYKT